MGTIYCHTQVSRAMVGGMGIALAAAVWWSLRVSDPLVVATAVVFGLLLVVFSTLTVRVRDGAMDVFFGPGLIRRRIPLRRIREVRVVKNALVLRLGHSGDSDRLAVEHVGTGWSGGPVY